MKREDALFNWLQIQIVADARPDDQSARETASFFLDVLQEDHQMSDVGYRREDAWYVLFGRSGTEEWTSRYPADSAESLLVAIESEPKYNQ